MANKPGPQRALGSRGQTINASAWPYFDGLLRAVSARTKVSYDNLVVEATRTYARQDYLYKGYIQGRIDPSTGRKFNPAYAPNSPYAYHVAGDAVDFGGGAGTRGTPVQRALHELGPSFGIFFEVSNELWHGRCDLRRAPNLSGASGGAIVFPEDEEDDMNEAQSQQLANIHAALFAGLDGVAPLRDIILQTSGRVGALEARVPDGGQKERFAFVRQQGRPEVFLSVDRQSLRWLESESQLADQRYTLAALGLENMPVQEVSNLSAFGSIGSNKRPADPFYAKI